ncbi:MAG: hypothetical protein ACYTJ0_10735 [Planctomycetota bacterium]|jgi:hypothetical protein
MPARRTLVLRALLPIGLLAAAAIFAAKGCSSTPTIANRDPTGQPFPTVTGASLEGESMTLPDALAGEPAVLLVGYVQGTQFDIDRWLMGLLQAETPTRIVELPTIPGLVPTMISGWIDDGMREGIPPEDWAAVVTLYGDAAQPVAELTGTEFPRRTRVLLLDGEGTIRWFDDAGYSPRKAMEVAQVAAALRVPDPE